MAQILVACMGEEIGPSYFLFTVPQALGFDCPAPGTFLFFVHFAQI